MIVENFEFRYFPNCPEKLKWRKLQNQKRKLVLTTKLFLDHVSQGSWSKTFWFFTWGTFINDVPRFLAFFDLPTYLRPIWSHFEKAVYFMMSYFVWPTPLFFSFSFWYSNSNYSNSKKVFTKKVNGIRICFMTNFGHFWDFEDK